jgi:tetratricopeptide (TPR) repeat protein
MDTSLESLQDLKAASRRAAAISAIGAIILFGTLGYSAFQLSKFQAQEAKLRRNLEDTKRQLEVTQGQLKEKQRQLEIVRNQLKNAPSSNDAVRKGVRHYHEGKFKEAVSAYDEALTLDPFNSTAYGLKGQALLKLGKTQQAISSLEKSIALQQDNVQAHYSLALAYWDAGKESAAVEEVKGLLRSDPEEYPPIRWDGNFAKFYQSDQFRAVLEEMQNKIVSIQRRLKELGYYKGAIEGIPGPDTRAAILRYQKEHSLPETGTWTEDLVKALKLEAPNNGA